MDSRGMDKSDVATIVSLYDAIAHALRLADAQHEFAIAALLADALAIAEKSADSE